MARTVQYNVIVTVAGAPLLKGRRGRRSRSAEAAAETAFPPLAVAGWEDEITVEGGRVDMPAPTLSQADPAGTAFRVSAVLPAVSAARVSAIRSVAPSVAAVARLAGASFPTTGGASGSAEEGVALDTRLAGGSRNDAILGRRPPPEPETAQGTAFTATRYAPALLSIRGTAFAMVLPMTASAALAYGLQNGRPSGLTPAPTTDRERPTAQTRGTEAAERQSFSLQSRALETSTGFMSEASGILSVLNERVYDATRSSIGVAAPAWARDGVAVPPIVVPRRAGGYDEKPPRAPGAHPPGPTVTPASVKTASVGSDRGPAAGDSADLAHTVGPPSRVLDAPLSSPTGKRPASVVAGPQIRGVEEPADLQRLEQMAAGGLPELPLARPAGGPGAGLFQTANGYPVEVGDERGVPVGVLGVLHSGAFNAAMDLFLGAQRIASGGSGTLSPTELPGDEPPIAGSPTEERPESLWNQGFASAVTRMVGSLGLGQVSPPVPPRPLRLGGGAGEATTWQEGKAQPGPPGQGISEAGRGQTGGVENAAFDEGLEDAGSSPNAYPEPPERSVTDQPSPELNDGLPLARGERLAPASGASVAGRGAPSVGEGMRGAPTGSKDPGSQPSPSPPMGPQQSHSYGATADAARGIEPVSTAGPERQPRSTAPQAAGAAGPSHSRFSPGRLPASRASGMAASATLEARSASLNGAGNPSVSQQAAPAGPGIAPVGLGFGRPWLQALTEVLGVGRWVVDALNSNDWTVGRLGVRGEGVSKREGAAQPSVFAGVGGNREERTNMSSPEPGTVPTESPLEGPSQHQPISLREAAAFLPLAISGALVVPTAGPAAPPTAIRISEAKESVSAPAVVFPELQSDYGGRRPAQRGGAPAEALRQAVGLVGALFASSFGAVTQGPMALGPSRASQGRGPPAAVPSSELMSSLEEASQPGPENLKEALLKGGTNPRPVRETEGLAPSGGSQRRLAAGLTEGEEAPAPLTMAAIAAGVPRQERPTSRYLHAPTPESYGAKTHFLMLLQLARARHAAIASRAAGLVGEPSTGPSTVLPGGPSRVHVREARQTLGPAPGREIEFMPRTPAHPPGGEQEPGAPPTKTEPVSWEPGREPSTWEAAMDALSSAIRLPLAAQEALPVSRPPVSPARVKVQARPAFAPQAVMARRAESPPQAEEQAESEAVETAPQSLSEEQAQPSSSPSGGVDLGELRRLIEKILQEELRRSGFQA